MSITLLLSFLLSMFANQASFTAMDGSGSQNVQTENLRKIITDDDGG